MRNKITDEMRRGVTVLIPVPKEFIGLWCITSIYGTHGSYHVLDEDGMVFESESHATLYRDKNYTEDIRQHYDVMKIEKNYPVWQTRMFICGLSEKELKKQK